jgi:indolepyruvate ferredoxin oxidoreductase
MAQKGGPVVSHLRIGPGSTDGAARLEEGRADAFLVFDLLTGVAPANLARLDPERTTAIVSTTQVPTGAMVADVAREDFPDIATLAARVEERTRAQVLLDAEAVALDAFGSQPAANLVVVGVAYQHGLLPQSATSIERAIALNGVAVDTNTAAFRLGRELALDPARAAVGARRTPPALRGVAARLCEQVDGDDELRDTLAWRVPELVAYQDADYASRYVDVVVRARAAERGAGTVGSEFSCTVARNLFHLMAYKDEYEVARLHRQAAFRDQVASEFGPGADVTFHLQPPAASRMGLRRKIPLSSRTAGAAFWGLTKMVKLRGTKLDPFGRSAERRDERRLIDDYVALVDDLAVHLGTDTETDAVRVAGLVDMVRGFAAVKQQNLERYRAELPGALADLSRSTP